MTICKRINDFLELYIGSVIALNAVKHLHLNIAYEKFIKSVTF